MTDWLDLTARGGKACHAVVGFMMWDARAKERFGALGFPNPDAWVVAWRLAALGDTPPPVVAAMTYSINPTMVGLIVETMRATIGTEAVLETVDDAAVPGLESIAPGLAADLGGLADDLWRGVDSIFHGSRPMFVAHRALPRPDDRDPGLSAWHAVNCIRELRGDNHWALCASEGLDDVEVGLLHSAMIDVDEYGGEEWIARSRGGDDDALTAAWGRLADRGLAADGRLTDEGRAFRLDLEHRTDVLTAPVWEAIGEDATVRFLDLVEPHLGALLDRINETAGPRWMPALRQNAADG